MRLEQVRGLVEIVKHGDSVSRAAEGLGVPHPAVSRQLRELERELGVDVVLRARSRLRGLTRPGAEIVDVARRILGDTAQLAKIARDFEAEESGTLAIATTHTQALYALRSEEHTSELQSQSNLVCR